MADLHDFQVDIVPDQGSVTTNKKDESYYVEMPKDEVQYKIRLKNNGSVKCDAVITIDGKNMGTFRINSYSEMLLERPSDVERRFTFFVGGSEGSKQGGYKPKDKNNGLVEVRFKPEKKPEPVICRGYTPTSRNLYDSCNGDDEECDGEEDMCYGDTFDSAPEMARGFSTNAAPIISSGKHGRANAAPMARSKGMTNAPTRGYKEGMTALTGDSSQKFVTVATLDYDYKNEVTIYLRLVYRDVKPKIEPLRSVGSKKSTGYPNPV